MRTLGKSAQATLPFVVGLSFQMLNSLVFRGLSGLLCELSFNPERLIAPKFLAVSERSLA